VAAGRSSDNYPLSLTPLDGMNEIKDSMAIFECDLT
jgi:hypothetical protein